MIAIIMLADHFYHAPRKFCSVLSNFYLFSHFNRIEHSASGGGPF